MGKSCTVMGSWLIVGLKFAIDLWSRDDHFGSTHGRIRALSREFDLLFF